MNRITKSTLLIGLLCLGAAAIPGAAGAATAPKTAKFKASLKGEQNITWSYNRAPEGSCYGGENAGGSVRMFYETAKPTTVTAYEIRKDNPIWDSTHQRVMFSPGFQASATATMEGSHSAGPPPFPADCEENGGGVIPQPVDCATATALINVSLAYVNKDRLLLRGDATSWDPGFEELRNMFSNCPYWQGGPYTHSTAEGDLESADVKLKEKQLFDAKGRKKIVLHGSSSDCWQEDGLAICGDETGSFRGQTVTAWTLTLKRVK